MSKPTELDTRNLVDEFKGLRVESIKETLSKRAFEFHIAIENLQHDFNIGSIVRTANAFNAGGVHIVGKRHWNKRGAMSTEKYLILYHHPNVDDFEKWAKNEKLVIVGIDNIEQSTPLSLSELPKKCVLVFGQEGPGLSNDMLGLCKTVVAVEQYGSTRSINVGAAAAIVMYEWVRRNATP